MSGMEPMLIGAALGGGLSAARGGNPLTGAMLGGVTGGIGGGILNTAGEMAKTAALNTAMNPANYVSPTSFMGVASQVPSALGSYMTANPALSLGLANSLIGETPQPISAPSAGLMRGNPSQAQMPSMAAMGRPQISLI